MRLEDAVEEYLGAKQNSITAKTLRWYKYHLTRFTLFCHEQDISAVSRITPATVQAAVNAYATENSNSNHGYVQVIKSFLSWCSKDEDMGVRDKTVRRIELPKLEESDVAIFTDVEVIKLLRACERMPLPYRAKAILLILLDTGIRASELCYDGSRPQEQTGLRLENVIFGKEDDSYIWVMGKGRKSRTLGLGNEARKAVKSYLNRERRNSSSEYLFLTRDREPLSIRMLEQFMTDLGQLAGVEDCYPHRCRHTWAVNQLLNGTSDLVLMHLMGHTSLASTQIYVRAMNHIQARKASSSVVDKIKKNTH